MFLNNIDKQFLRNIICKQYVVLNNTTRNVKRSKETNKSVTKALHFI